MLLQSDDGSEPRRDGDGNSESDGEGGVDEDQPPPIGVYDHVAPDVDENKEKKVKARGPVVDFYLLSTTLRRTLLT